MTDITWPDKATGDQFTADEANETKEAVNSKSDIGHTHPSSDIIGVDLTSDELTDVFVGAALAGGAEKINLADASLDVAAGASSTKLAAFLEAVASLDATTRASIVGALHVGFANDGPGNPGEFWITSAAGNLTGAGAGGNDLEEILDRTPGTFPFSPDLLGAYLAKGEAVASASTITVSDGLWCHVTGTTTITEINFSFDGTLGGRAAILFFDDVVQLTHSSTLYIRGAANWTTDANDAALVLSEDGDVVYVFPFGGSGSGASAASTTETLTGTSTTKYTTPDSMAALWEKGSDIASAATITIGEGGFFHVTGTTTISDIDFGTDKTGRRVKLCFDEALQLTHSSTLILPGAANITTTAGDIYEFVSEGSDVARCSGRLLTTVSGGALVGDGSETPAFLGIQVGHASDTTVTRGAAGLLEVEGVRLVTVSATQTLTNKTLTAPDIGTPTAGTLTNCTGLPVAGIAASTATALGVGSIELGHASDTTITRTGAGAIAVEGVGVALNSTSATHTAGTIELGAASDTTLSRSSAGVLAVEGSAVLTVAGSKTLTGGFNATTFDAGTKSSGTFTPDPANGNFQRAMNNGAHTLAPPASDCCIVIQYTNDSSAGTVTTSGYTKVTGDALTTTNADDFMLVVTRCNSFSVLNITALQ